MTRSRSRELYDRALSVMPGGVNSPVRAVRPYPRFVERGDGGYVVDADGTRLLDFVMGYGPLLLGHDLPEAVLDRVTATVEAGPMYGAPTAVEVELAEFVVGHVESVDQVRFVNSGTEATTSAVRLARGVTGRDKVVAMAGGYHGAMDSTLVEGEDGATEASSPGIPASLVAETIPVPFNDEDALTRAFERHGDEIAAVITEPLLANTGIVEPDPGFHDAVQDLCDEYGSLLVLDEVITGFRIGGLDGAQAAYDIDPDLTTFGKIVGGGFPVGAIGGRAELMEAFTPVGDVFQAGTFSGHPVTMAAGLETLRYAEAENVHERLDALGDRLRDGLRDVVAETAPGFTVVGTGSLFKVVFTRPGREISNGADVTAAQRERWDRLFRPAMLDHGVLLTANQLEANFLSAAHTEDDVDAALDAYADAL